MYEPLPKLTVREMIRETITPSRIGLLSWAFAAVVMGTVGLASFQFGGQAMLSSSKRMLTGTFTLPPGGDVATTASIRSVGPSTAVEVMRLPGNQPYGDASGLTRSQIEVLQREIVGLRRRLSALTEQNLAYSSRIAALEQEAAQTRGSGSALSDAGNDKTPAQPRPGVIRTKTARDTDPLQSVSRPTIPAPVPKTAASRPKTVMKTAIETGSVQAAVPGGLQTLRTSPEAMPRRVSIYRAPEPAVPLPGIDIDTREPVRIVTLPDAGGNPQTTGSIPPQDVMPPPEAFNATPTSPQPAVVAPTYPVDKSKSRGGSQVKRSDFGAVIGHFETEAAAAAAWARFKDQNRDQVHNMNPLLSRQSEGKGGIALIVGPFANAADAAVACVRMLEVTALCRPALFAGETLVTAAEFPNTAF